VERLCDRMSWHFWLVMCGFAGLLEMIYRNSTTWSMDYPADVVSMSKTEVLTRRPSDFLSQEFIHLTIIAETTNTIQFQEPSFCKKVCIALTWGYALGVVMCYCVYYTVPSYLLLCIQYTAVGVIVLVTRKPRNNWSLCLLNWADLTVELIASNK
jgi:hypothetical protein